MAAGAAFSVKVTGLEKSKRAMGKTAKVFPRQLEKNMRLAGEIVIGAARKQFKGSRTRAIYSISGGRRKKRKKPRPVTSPKDKLGIFEGAYTKSISLDARVTGPKKRRTFIVEVGPSVVYAAAHEFGTGNMPQRQVLTPAVAETANQVFRLIGKSMKVMQI